MGQRACRDRRAGWLQQPHSLIRFRLRELSRRPIRRTARRKCTPDAPRRTVRPILRVYRLLCNGAISCRLESITADKLLLVMSDGTRETWTRARGGPNGGLGGSCERDRRPAH